MRFVIGSVESSQNSLQYKRFQHRGLQDSFCLCRTAAFPGAQRLVEFAVANAIETSSAFDIRWRLIEYAPVNPR
jgi:hypothetical protein